MSQTFVLLLREGNRLRNSLFFQKFERADSGEESRQKVPPKFEDPAKKHPNTEYGRKRGENGEQNSKFALSNDSSKGQMATRSVSNTVPN